MYICLVSGLFLMKKTTANSTAKVIGNWLSVYVYGNVFTKALIHFKALQSSARNLNSVPPNSRVYLSFVWYFGGCPT